MRILAIDPGPMQSAFVVWDGTKLWEQNIVPNDKMKLVIWANNSICEAVAVEHLQCFGMAVGKEVFETAYWIGDFRARCVDTKFMRIYRGEVKMHLCNSMRAKDGNIRQVLLDRFGVKGTKKNPGFFYGFKADMWSAFAVAVTAFDRMNGN